MEEQSCQLKNRPNPLSFDFASVFSNLTVGVRGLRLTFFTTGGGPARLLQITAGLYCIRKNTPFDRSFYAPDPESFRQLHVSPEASNGGSVEARSGNQH